MTSKELRQKFLDFFKAKGHAIISSASLIPENDPTVLFTTAGMHPLVPFLMGELHPAGKRIANCQKCLRTSDIDEVGDNTHHTFFEMLGNWSLGDYFKKEAIAWSWEFLTSPEWLGLEKNKIAISVFAGDKDAPRDEEAVKIWLEVTEGEVQDRIDYLPKEKNWWIAGEIGPCGPDTEMFYWVGSEAPPKKIKAGDLANSPNWVEIWNDVFMQYNKKIDGSFELLNQQNVDTGMGLERTVAVLNGLDDNYKTDLYINIIRKIEFLSEKKYGQTEAITRAMRIIADHLKAATLIMADDKGIRPSNIGQGYVVRRLIRRAIRYGKQLEIKGESWTKEIVKVVSHDYSEIYQELRKNIDFVIEEFKREEEKFVETIQDGLKKAEKIIKYKKPIRKEVFIQMMSFPIEEKKAAFRNFYRNKRSSVKEPNDFIKKGIKVSNEEIDLATITGKEAFDLYQTYGFPLEMIIDLAQERCLLIDGEDFRGELLKHQELSRTAAIGTFKGGLADSSEETKKLHTAAHLLLAALRKVLGNHVFQKGSNITSERLRFDFSHNEKMTEDEKQKVEDLVNSAIKQDLPVSCEEMTLDQAKKRGAHGIFETKYGEKVRVYTIGEEKLYFSKEICGGPHVKRTGELGKFKIIKEESSSAGVRRIKAIIE